MLFDRARCPVNDRPEVVVEKLADPELPNDAGTPPGKEYAMLYCPICSVSLEGLKCKLFCPQCGYYMSCADYY